MGKIEKILKKGPVEGQTTEVYPVTSTKAVYDENNKRLDNIITGLQKSVYLNTPIPISTENTPESMAQNVKNIADYVKKAKAAGITDVNGMGVTCLIDDYFSGVGYIFGNTNVSIQGIKIPDDIVDNAVFTISNGRYDERFIVGVDELDKVTSEMLVQGARKPIILTLDTTEIDEETYQKLLSDDVDVWLKIDQLVGKFCPLIYKFDSGSALKLYFTCFSIEGETIYDTYLNAYEMGITKTSPHTCSIFENFNNTLDVFINNAGYLNEAYLNPILQQINLTGTDADRKAKLDQFAKDWKTLTGASDLVGARFVGQITTPKGGYASVLFTYNIGMSTFTGVTNLDDSDYRIHYSVYLDIEGALTIIPLFSHLEAITIQTLNIPANKKKNSDAIQAYVNNLIGIEVDVTKGYIIPIKTVGFENGVGIIYPNVDNSYKGICIANGHSYIITISKDGTWDKQDLLLDSGSDYTILNTSAKDILGAINEINTLANNKQDTLTSGTNIKTINNQSLLGSGNIEISAPSITVDTTMSDTSTNPVQNKVIKAYIDGLVGNVAAQLAQI